MNDENTRLILFKLDEMNEKFDQKFDKIDEEFDKIDEKFDKIDERFEKIDNRIDTLKDDLEKTLKEDLEKALMDRFFVFEQRFERAISLLLETLNDRNEREQEQESRITRLEKRLDTYRAFTIRQEEKVANMETGMLKWYQDNPGVPKLF